MPQQWSSVPIKQAPFQFMPQQWSSFSGNQEPCRNDFSTSDDTQSEFPSPCLSISDILVDFDDPYVTINLPPLSPQTLQWGPPHSVELLDCTVVDGCFSNLAERHDARLEDARNRPQHDQHRPSLTTPTSAPQPQFQVKPPRVDTLRGPSTREQTGFPPGAFFGPTSNPDFYDASAADEYLRVALGIPRHKPVSLWSIIDPPDGEKPPIPLRLLIGLAIYDSDQKSLTLQGIYDALSDRFKYFRRQDSIGIQSWRKSVRHALSLYSFFTKIERRKADPGKGCYWMLDVAAAGVEGQYTRPRKRKNQGNGNDKERESSKLGSRPSKGKPRYCEASWDFYNGSNASVSRLNESSFAQAFEESYSRFQGLMASDTSATGWPPAPRTDLAF
ncbi:hypothetical protein C8R45DRAFT_295691 [Mycena sanguinolenta]|nr:hypothetical protein C8R45DRAFT_295691 [Mycena sanguinolenta]